MTVGRYFDRTIAVRRQYPEADINRTTGDFVDPTETQTTIAIHVTQVSPTQLPRLDEAFPAGVSVQKGDIIVKADATLNLQPGELLEFWGSVWRIVEQLRQYDNLDAVVRHERRAYLVRRYGDAE